MSEVSKIYIYIYIYEDKVAYDQSHYLTRVNKKIKKPIKPIKPGKI